MRKLSYLIITCTLLFILTLSAIAQVSSIESQVRMAESHLPLILEQNNIEELDKILDPSFTVQSSDGVFVGKAQLLNAFRNGRNPYLKFRPVADSVVIVNENTVITSGKEIYTHKADKKESVRFFYHVWIAHKNLWLLAARMIAPIPEKHPN